MLTEKEKAELEALKRDPYVKLAQKQTAKHIDPDKKRLYQYRWLQKKGKRAAEPGGIDGYGEGHGRE